MANFGGDSVKLKDEAALLISSIACLLLLTLPAFAYDSMVFPGYGSRAEWSRAGNIANEGNACADRGEHLKAIALYDKAIAIYPTPAQYFDRGNCLSSLNRLDEANQSYKKAIAGAADYWKPYCALGDNYLVKGDYKNAEIADKKAMELAPSEPIPVMNLAEVYIGIKRFTDARKLLEKARTYPKANTSELKKIISDDLLKITGAK